MDRCSILGIDEWCAFRFNRASNDAPSRPVRKPPSSIFEADPTNEETQSLPVEIVFMLKNIRFVVVNTQYEAY